MVHATLYTQQRTESINNDFQSTDITCIIMVHATLNTQQRTESINNDFQSTDIICTIMVHATLNTQQRTESINNDLQSTDITCSTYCSHNTQYSTEDIHGNITFRARKEEEERQPKNKHRNYACTHCTQHVQSQ